MPIPYIKLEIRRGNKADLPVLDDGELGWCEDTKEMFIGTSSAGNQKVSWFYSPGTPGNWQGTPPNNLGAALDRLASVVATLFGGPIP